MNTFRRCLKSELSGADPGANRRGAFLVLALFCLIGCLAAAALSVDVGYLSVQKVRMQNAVDAAALAAAQEIVNAVKTAPQGTQDPTAYALGEARQTAAYVAGLNGVYVDPNKDVVFGQRQYNAATKVWSTKWNTSPANCVKVTARRTETDTTAKDGKLKTFFGGVGGTPYAKVTTEAVGFIEARDVVIVHDFSRSMNFDSQFSDEITQILSDSQIVTNLSYVWNDLNLDLPAFDFYPDYMTLTQTTSGSQTSVTFKYKNLSVSSNATLQSVKLNYTTGSSSTFSVSGQSAEITGTGDISSAIVTTQTLGTVTQTTITNSNINVTFSADRKTVTITSKKALGSMQVSMQNGSTASVTFPNNSKSYTYNASDKVGSLKIDLSGGSVSWINFDPPDTGTPTTVTQQFDDTNANVKVAFGLDSFPYPYPYGSWDEYIDHVRNYSPYLSKGYREMYGGLTFANYLLRVRSSHTETPALCRTRHYPFQAIKDGHTMFCTFLKNLGFDDRLGMVSYDTNHRLETKLNDPDPTIPKVDISASPISNDFTALTNLMLYKQANFYSPATNMGGGLQDAIATLDSYSRAGSRPTIVLMTDGVTNTMDPGAISILPSNWNWDTMFDYNGDGIRDFYTTDNQKKYVLKLAYTAQSKGYTVHAMSVGALADTELMKAVAFIGGGICITVPGGTTVEAMQDTVMAGFYKIASAVPPAKLLNSSGN